MTSSLDSEVVSSSAVLCLKPRPSDFFHRMLFTILPADDRILEDLQGDTSKIRLAHFKFRHIILNVLGDMARASWGHLSKALSPSHLALIERNCFCTSLHMAPPLGFPGHRLLIIQASTQATPLLWSSFVLLAQNWPLSPCVRLGSLPYICIIVIFLRVSSSIRC